MQVEAPWYVQWFQDPGFKADVVTQWNALMEKGVFTAWLASIQQQAAGLEQFEAKTSSAGRCRASKSGPTPRRPAAMTAKSLISQTG